MKPTVDRPQSAEKKVNSSLPTAGYLLLYAVRGVWSVVRGPSFFLWSALCISTYKNVFMKLNALMYSSLFLLVSFISSCEVIGGIFKAGVWVGILIVVVIIGLIIWLIGRGRG